MRISRTLILALAFSPLLGGCDTVRNVIDAFKPAPKEEKTETTESTGEVRQDRLLALVLDNSGSMKRTDERRMMLFSSLVFVDMLAEQDRLFVTSFPGPETVSSDNLATETIDATLGDWVLSGRDRFGPIRNDTGGNAEIKDWIRRLPYHSQITVFTEPIKRAIDELETMGPDDDKRYIVLFTDGNTDRGAPRTTEHMEWVHERERQSLQALVEPLRRHGIVFYAVVLGAETRADHLEPLARATGGAIVRAESSADLAEKFAEVFGKILETKVESYDLRGTTEIPVNKHVKELIVLAPSDGDRLSLGLKEPGGRDLSAPLDPADGFVRRDRIETQDTYQIIHVASPRSGDWKFRLKGVDRTEVLIVQNYDVFLQVDGRYPRRGMMNMANQIRGRLVDSAGEPIRDPELFREGDFQYGLTYRDAGDRAPPDEDYGFEMSITPTDTLEHDLVVSVTNGSWLTRTLALKFSAKDGAVLRVGDADFGEVTPYADGLYFWWNRWLTSLLGLPHAENWKSNVATVSFEGTDEALIGVVFQLDSDPFHDTHHMRVTDKRHRQQFVVDDDLRANLHLDLDRNATSLDGPFPVPIIYPTTEGKIKGDRELNVLADVRELSWPWATSHLWLQWLIYLWIFLFFIYRPLHYALVYSPSGIRTQPSRDEKRFRPVRPNETRPLAFVKALLFLYPLAFVKSVRRGKRAQRSREYLANGPGAAFRRFLQLAAGLPFGPYARPFSARVGNKGARQFFLRARRVIQMELGTYTSAFPRRADMPRPGDAHRLHEVKNRMIYQTDSSEEGFFAIKK